MGTEIPFNKFSVIVFTVEYVLRLWCSVDILLLRRLPHWPRRDRRHTFYFLDSEGLARLSRGSLRASAHICNVAKERERENEQARRSPRTARSNKMSRGKDMGKDRDLTRDAD